MAHDVVNPRMLEFEVAKEILAELFDIRTHEVDEMIRQRMEDRLTGFYFFLVLLPIY
jgi:hypothetical protein